MKRYGNLFEQIISEENMHLAYLKTRKGKRSSHSYLEFKEYAMLHLRELREELEAGMYHVSEYRDFYIYDPKKRLISALPFRDRVVQHALNNVLEPIFDASFLPYTFACRPGKGTHAGVKHIQSSMRKHGSKYFLKIDLRKYFPNTWREGLYKKIDQKIKCKKTIDLMERIVPREGVGIKIGSLSSQLNANINGTYIDRFVHERIKPEAWARYMDDVILLDSNADLLRRAKNEIEQIVDEKMKMQFSKWSIASTNRGVNFLGYRIWSTHKLLRKQSVIKAKKRMKAITDDEEMQRFLGAWLGHARWADVHNLLESMEVRVC